MFEAVRYEIWTYVVAYVTYFTDSRHRKGNKCMKGIRRRKKFGEGKIHTRKYWQLVVTAHSQAILQIDFWYVHWSSA